MTAITKEQQERIRVARENMIAAMARVPVAIRHADRAFDGLRAAVTRWDDLLRLLSQPLPRRDA